MFILSLFLLLVCLFCFLGGVWAVFYTAAKRAVLDAAQELCEEECNARTRK